jgi:hypothetical protein
MHDRALIHRQIHDRSFYWISTGTSVEKSGVIKLDLYAQLPFLSEMMRSCKCFPYASKMSTLIPAQARCTWYNIMW